MVTRQVFDNALGELREKIRRLAVLVKERIILAVDSLVKQDTGIANQIIIGDKEVNDLQADIEQECMLLIATQQPLAKDLRKIVAGFKISIFLERMGDLAVDIAKVTLKIGQDKLIKPLIDIPQMSKLVCEMIDKGLDAYVAEDVQAATDMTQIDDHVDHLYNQVLRELLVYMMEDPKTISQATLLMFVGRYLERMGDYCTNIGEEIVYIATAERSDLNI